MSKEQEKSDACDWLENLEGDAWADACEEIAASVQKHPEQAEGAQGEPLPYWEPCNPACDPELNGFRDRKCNCAQARAAMAPELERPEVAGYLAAGAFYHPDRAVAEAGARAVLGSCGNAEAMITVAQHDRTVEALKKEAARSEQHRNDQADLIVSLRTEVIALRARAVVVPPLDYRDDKFAEGWNSCIDEIADLNGKVVSEGLLRRLSALFPTEMGDDGSGRAGWLPHVRETVAELRALLGEGKES